MGEERKDRGYIAPGEKVSSSTADSLILEDHVYLSAKYVYLSSKYVFDLNKSKYINAKSWDGLISRCLYASCLSTSDGGVSIGSSLIAESEKFSFPVLSSELILCMSATCSSGNVFTKSGDGLAQT